MIKQKGMKFIYVITERNNAVEVLRRDSARFESLTELAGPISLENKEGGKLMPISIKKERLEEKIDQLLERRKTKPPDVPEYGRRFKDEEVFEVKLFKGAFIRLCNTGADNQIIFLINLFDAFVYSTEETFYCSLQTIIRGFVHGWNSRITR